MRFAVVLLVIAGCRAGFGAGGAYRFNSYKSADEERSVYTGGAAELAVFMPATSRLRGAGAVFSFTALSKDYDGAGSQPLVLMGELRYRRAFASGPPPTPKQMQRRFFWAAGAGYGTVHRYNEHPIGGTFAELGVEAVQHFSIDLSLRHRFLVEGTASGERIYYNLLMVAVTFGTPP